ncbi:MAG: hypothetical protein WCC22_15535 [Terriglobales bacterium]
MPQGVANDQRPATSDQFQPMASSSGDSSGVPQRRQITAEQSPQVSGSFTSAAQTGQYSTSADCFAPGARLSLELMKAKL